MDDLTRLPNESTAVFLGRVLDELELNDMANRARLFHFDDYFCPEEIDDGGNINRLVTELQFAKLTSNDEDRIQDVIDAAMDGVFDGTREEADQWGKSEDGQETFRQLLEGS